MPFRLMPDRIASDGFKAHPLYLCSSDTKFPALRIPSVREFHADDNLFIVGVGVNIQHVLAHQVRQMKGQGRAVASSYWLDDWRNSYAMAARGSRVSACFVPPTVPSSHT